MQGSSNTVNIENEMLNLSYELGYDLPYPMYLKLLETTHPKQNQTADHFQWHYEENLDLPDPTKNNAMRVCHCQNLSMILIHVKL